MSYWFSCFVIYSFLGYCLEKLFAYATHSDRQVRKCFLLLPLCPVYGAAMVAVLLLSSPEFPFSVQIVLGAVICTAVEYLVHLFYDKAFHTQFWNYSDLSFHIGGRICPHFAVIWGILSTVAVEYIHPTIAAIAFAIPNAVIFCAWMVLSLDCVLTSAWLRRYNEPEMLSLSALFAQQ